jgi:hypothetical protein
VNSPTLPKVPRLPKLPKLKGGRSLRGNQPILQIARASSKFWQSWQ